MTAAELEALADLVAARVVDALRTTLPGSRVPVVPTEGDTWHDHERETGPMDHTDTAGDGSSDLLSEEQQRLRRLRHDRRHSAGLTPSTAPLPSKAER